MKILHGSPCTIAPHHSRVILRVPKGCHGIILGNIHKNFKISNHLVKESDCIVSPMCEFEFHSYDDIPEGAWIKIEVPHIVKNLDIASKIRVISRDRYQKCTEYAQKLEPEQEPYDYENIYYRFGESYLEIFTHHFSQFIVFAENTTLDEVMDKHNLHSCSKNVELLIFTKWIQNYASGPLLEVSLNMCSLQHEEKDYRQVCIAVLCSIMYYFLKDVYL